MIPCDAMVSNNKSIRCFTFTVKKQILDDYSTLKRKETVTHVTTWMSPGNIMLSEISHIQKDRYCVIPLV